MDWHSPIMNFTWVDVRKKCAARKTKDYSAFRRIRCTGAFVKSRTSVISWTVFVPPFFRVCCCLTLTSKRSLWKKRITPRSYLARNCSSVILARKEVLRACARERPKAVGLSVRAGLWIHEFGGGILNNLNLRQFRLWLTVGLNRLNPLSGDERSHSRKSSWPPATFCRFPSCLSGALDCDHNALGPSQPEQSACLCANS